MAGPRLGLQSLRRDPEVADRLITGPVTTNHRLITDRVTAAPSAACPASRPAAPAMRGPGPTAGRPKAEPPSAVCPASLLVDLTAAAQARTVHHSAEMTHSAAFPASHRVTTTHISADETMTTIRAGAGATAAGRGDAEALTACPTNRLTVVTPPFFEAPFTG